MDYKNEVPSRTCQNVRTSLETNLQDKLRDDRFHKTNTVGNRHKDICR